MSIFPIILMSVFAGWAICATVLATVYARRLRNEREAHGQAQDRNARYRTALRRAEEKAAAVALQFEALQREHASLRQAAQENEAGPAERPVPTVMIDCLDISGEIGTLFEHVARVATAIRDHSAYTRGHYGPEHSKARYDLLWLSDCLHTFDRVGKALAAGSQRALASACQELLSMYDSYLVDSSGYDSSDTFRRLSDRVPLTGVSDAIRSIAMKTAAPAAAAVATAPSAPVSAPVPGPPPAPERHVPGSALAQQA